MTKILAAAISLGLMATSGLAQSTVTVRIPFAFYVGETKLPAGSYVIDAERPQVVRITNTSTRNVDAAFNTVAITRPGMSNQPGGLVFYRYDRNYFLSEIWTSGNSTGHLVPKSAFQLELSRVTPSIRIESLSIARQ